jgi:hypothetical protein
MTTMMRTLCVALALLCALSAIGAPTTEDERTSWRRTLPDDPRAERLRDFFDLVAGELEPGDVFDEAFFEHTAREELTSILASVRERSGGSLRFVRTLWIEDDGVFAAELADAQERQWFAGLELAPGSDKLLALDLRPQPRRAEGAKVYDTWDEVIADVRALAGEASLAVHRLSDVGVHTPLALHEHERELNVAQLAQLFVLSAAADAVAAGDVEWSTPVELEARFASLPPSEYLDQIGEQVSFGDLVTSAASLRDSVASDAVFHTVGRERVIGAYNLIAGELPDRATPWLTLRDFALLKQIGKSVV